MNNLELLNTTQDFAVVGMNDDPKKYANKIFKKLKAKNKKLEEENKQLTENYNEAMLSLLKEKESVVSMEKEKGGHLLRINMLEVM